MHECFMFFKFIALEGTCYLMLVPHMMEGLCQYLRKYCYKLVRTTVLLCTVGILLQYLLQVSGLASMESVFTIQFHGLIKTILLAHLSGEYDYIQYIVVVCL